MYCATEPQHNLSTYHAPILELLQGMADTEEETKKCIAAICYINKTIGFACYDELSNTIFADSIPVCFEDMEDVLAKIKMAADPTLFLIHPTILSNKSLLDLLVCGIDGIPDTYRHTTMKVSMHFYAHKDIMCLYMYLNTPFYMYYNEEFILECGGCSRDDVH